MPYLYEKYYRNEKEVPIGQKKLREGYYGILKKHPLFGHLPGDIDLRKTQLSHKDSIACVDKSGCICVNIYAGLNPAQWSYVIIHNLLHLAFRHFDADLIPFAEDGSFNPAVWNKACDIYIARFLADDMNFGEAIFNDPRGDYPIRLNDERKIYDYLIKTEQADILQTYGTNSVNRMDMIDIEHPIYYKKGETNMYAECFSYVITHAVTEAVGTAGGHLWDSKEVTPVLHAAQWFLNHYPLLGGLAASFKIMEDPEFCQQHEIQIAAVDASLGEIYANPACGLSMKEWQFVLAHEYLHAGLQHHRRCQGRDPYLWNIACDYVVNDWLHEMQIGVMPKNGVLYDETLHGLSAESIYDTIVKEMRKHRKMATFRGYGQGDIFSNNGPRFERADKGVSLDEFFRNALQDGLNFHTTNRRGYLPAGLVEEIKALSTPPIPWDVELAKWFDAMFPPLEKHRTYARPSRRQGATPDIPRPSYALREQDLDSRTFGVVVDTSGSMSARLIGLALGAIASYAMSKDVPFVRVIFCDADATDAGYMSPEDIAGKVEVTGRGGTVLQPGIDALEKACDFPQKGPILIITDGYIESNLRVRREHAFLIPKGNKLPFHAKGNVFYFKE